MQPPNQPGPLKLLSNLAQKLVLHSKYSGVECRVLPPAMRGQPYVIQVSQGRVMRQVVVDGPAMQRLEITGQADASLIRELQGSIQTVMRLSQRGQ
jgi:hypothetical protein